jgi:hypothetical protein
MDSRAKSYSLSGVDDFGLLKHIGEVIWFVG